METALGLVAHSTKLRNRVEHDKLHSLKIAVLLLLLCSTHAFSQSDPELEKNRKRIVSRFYELTYVGARYCSRAGGPEKRRFNIAAKRFRNTNGEFMRVFARSPYFVEVKITFEDALKDLGSKPPNDDDRMVCGNAMLLMEGMNTPEGRKTMRDQLAILGR